MIVISRQIANFIVGVFVTIGYARVLIWLRTDVGPIPMVIGGVIGIACILAFIITHPYQPYWGEFDEHPGNFWDH